VDLGIEGRVALVTGASRGLGRAIAGALAREGAQVAVASRSGQRIERAAVEIGHGARPFVADTDQPARMGALVAEVEEALGPIEVLVTNTGGPPAGYALGFEPGDWERAYRSLVLAPLALIGAAAPRMRQRGWGRIVNVTSIATREPIPGLVLSNANRLAAIGLFKTLSRELARDGVLVNSVAPGRIATDRIAELSGRPLEELRDEPQPDIPVGRLGTPQEFADAVVFLCSECASYLAGVNLLVDGGLSAGI
jgi:3-oxoacyl-[acyl-carrier protein] reductase